ncbi:toll/interleukin-1 receptor domain-containing protein [Candidatus Poribacteria bacterium]
MNIFISWSGDRSREVAERLRTWLQDVIQVLELWISSADIKTGAIWFPEIRNRLREADIVIVCLTRENMKEPWILFEAGAGSVTYPYLLDLRPGELTGPLSLLQARVANKHGTRELLYDINDALVDGALSKEQIDRAFDRWWPDLEGILNGMRSSPKRQPPDRHSPDGEVNPHSLDGEATDLFRQATSSCYWLGILGTPQFRRDIISINTDERRLLSLLLDESISGIHYKFLFINPFSQSFEQRMKEEGKDERDIERVRGRIFEVSTELIQAYNIARKTSNDLWVGFHCEPLIWNMIIADETIYLGSYVPKQTGHVRPLLRLCPAERPSLNYSFHRYYEHLQKRAIQLDSNDCQQMRFRRALVHSARMHDNVECDPYVGLHKGNVLAIRSDQVTKVFMFEEACCAEDVGLRVLESDGPTPEVYDKSRDERSITRQYLHGPRLYDVFMTLREFIDLGDRCDATVAERASNLRDRLIERSANWLHYFHGTDIQISLSRELGGMAQNYEFRRKAHESLEILKENLAIDRVYWIDVTRIMNDVCGILDEESKNGKFLRDANPKNTILQYPEIAGVGERNHVLEQLLIEREADELADDLWSRCYHIDFESVWTKSTAFDDFIHIYGSPAIGGVDEAVNRISQKLQSQDDPILWYTVLFRSLRSLSRRVYYRYNRHNLYEQRYKGEALEHFAVLAEEAVKRIDVSRVSQQLEPLYTFFNEVNTLLPRT